MENIFGWLSYASFFLVFASAFAIITLGLNLQWGFTGLFNGTGASQELFEQDCDFEFREVCTEAVVRAAATERYVRVG